MNAIRPTILIADDDVRLLDAEEQILKELGYSVIKASDGKAALTAFGDGHTVALVLLDIAMPEMDGFEVCRRIREFSQVPVIMVTAQAGSNEMLKGFEVGADDYLIKPFRRGELAARVKAVLRRTMPEAVAA